MAAALLQMEDARRASAVAEARQAKFNNLIAFFGIMSPGEGLTESLYRRRLVAWLITGCLEPGELRSHPISAQSAAKN